MPVSTNAILIATDIVSDGALVKKLLSEEFKHIVVSTDPDKVAGDFVRYQPDVLVLAFKELEKSERYSLNLYRFCPEMHRRPHRTVILCSKDEVTRAYELCMKDHYDDYILFWPMTYDKPHLAMSVHHMLRELTTHKGDIPSAAEFAVQARHLAELETMLARQVGQVGQHIEVSSRAMEQVEQDIGTALDVFSQRLTSDSLQDSATAKHADDLKKEISRFKREEVQQCFRTAAKTANPLKRWTHEFKQECEPLLESARALTAMAGRILPVVLVVDDDEFQRKLIAQILETEKYHLVFAGSGIEALNVMRKVRPDIILMDVMMPDMDGIEATQLLKAAPPLARIPVIMITGQSEGKVVLDSRKAGAVDFVVKPLDRTTLLVKIAGVLKASTTLLRQEPAHLETES